MNSFFIPKADICERRNPNDSQYQELKTLQTEGISLEDPNAQKKCSNLANLQQKKNEVLSKMKGIHDLDDENEINQLYQQAESLQMDIDILTKDHAHKVRDYKRLKNVFVIAKQTHSFYMNKNSFICARPWKSIVVAGESIFNANISSSSMSESDSSKKSPRFDRENEPKSTTTTTSQSVIIIGTNGSESQLDEVFIAGEKHKGERKRRAVLSSNKEKRSSAPTEHTKLYSTFNNAIIKNNLQNEAYT